MRESVPLCTDAVLGGSRGAFFMQNFTRRLMSGASLALLAFGVPSIARASSGPQKVPGSNLFVGSQLSAQLFGYATRTSGGQEFGPNSVFGKIDGDLDSVEDAVVLDASLLGTDQEDVEDKIIVDEITFEGKREGNTNVSAATEYLRSQDLPASHTHFMKFVRDTIGERFSALYAARPAYPNKTGLFGFHTASGFTNTAVNSAGHGRATHVYQSSSVNHFTNFKLVAARGFEVAEDKAVATGIGAHQVADDPSNLLLNGNHTLVGFGTAYVALSQADARGVGLEQTAVGLSSSAKNIATNGHKGFIGGYAFAGDVISANGVARADGTGVVQRAISLSSAAKNDVVNNGLIAAFAEAYDAHSMYAHAVAVSQNADVIFGGGQAHNTVDNLGRIWASAFAVGGTYAHSGHATAIGVVQTADDSTRYAEDLANNYRSGEIVALAAVLGESKGDYAYAQAVGVYQEAAGPNAQNIVHNSGLIAAGALATETGAQFARARATGVDQRALGNTGLQANFIHNNTGATIVAGAAVSDAHTLQAYAAGVYQLADAHTAHNSIGNFGLIEAGALAFTGTDLFAQAVAVEQIGTAGASKATNIVDNHNAIIGVASAHHGVDAGADAVGLVQAGLGYAHDLNSVTNAVGALIGASAYVYYAHTGAGDSGHGNASAVALAQEVGNGLPFPKAGSNVVHNRGDIVAVAKVSSAADAEAVAAAVLQYAAASAADNYVSNHGFIGASAVAVDARLGATALAIGVAQEAYGKGPGDVFDSVHNYTGGEIVAFAQAGDKSEYRGIADAFGIFQYATGHTAHNYVDNSGFVGAQAEAYGHGDGFAYAYADAVYQDPPAILNKASNTAINHKSDTMVALASARSGFDVLAGAKGVNQSANAHAAKNYVSNDGLIAALAFASHGSDEYEGGPFDTEYYNRASARAYGIDEHAYGYAAHNSVTNAGTIVAGAHVFDAHFATALAKGVNQHAGYSGAADHSATNILANAKGGVIGASAVADADRNASSYVAHARAYGVDQHATGYSAAKDHVVNHGSIGAVASASYAVDVYAEAKGINQVADGYHGVTNYVSNDGLVGAFAFAHGINGPGYADFASAAAYGIDQHGNGYNANNTVYNGGTVFAVASAYNVSGEAEVVAKGINQHAIASRTAQNYVSNNGFIFGLADANNVETAYVRAYGIDQHATDQATNGFNHVFNAKGKTIAAVAHISEATGDEYHYAQAKAVNQVATGTISAANYVANNGLIGASAFIHSEDLGYGNANVRAYGVDQHASATHAFNSVLNHGTIAAVASVSNAYDAKALAKGINQHASGNDFLKDDGPTAANFVHNTHLVAGVALVHDNYTATARAYGVDQHAFASVKAQNTVLNDKGATIGAYASASYGEFEHARAKGINQHATASKTTGAQAQNYVANNGLVVGVDNAYGGLQFDGPTIVDVVPAYDASARAWGVDEHAYQASLAHNSVANNGTIAANAHASFAEDVFAEAKGDRKSVV